MHINRTAKAVFLSTLSLRRATSKNPVIGINKIAFLSTLSLRRATFDAVQIVIVIVFLSTLSLRRATQTAYFLLTDGMISIHALLAESDERANSFPNAPPQISIHALLAESDSAPRFTPTPSRNFYPRSPCGERPKNPVIGINKIAFLSTLSLRRATFDAVQIVIVIVFLSTLSLRRATAVGVILLS